MTLCAIVGPGRSRSSGLSGAAGPTDLAVTAGPRTSMPPPIRQVTPTYDWAVLGSDEVLSKGDLFCLAMAAVSLIIVVAAATEGQWLAVAAFSILVATNLAMVVLSRRGRGHG